MRPLSIGFGLLATLALLLLWLDMGLHHAYTCWQLARFYVWVLLGPITVIRFFDTQSGDTATVVIPFWHWLEFQPHCCFCGDQNLLRRPSDFPAGLCARYLSLCPWFRTVASTQD